MIVTTTAGDETAARELAGGVVAGDRVDALTEHLRAVHPYDLPEIVVVPVVGGSAEYLAWVSAETR